MAHSREKGGRVVFIGNIPYGVSEEQICEIFGRCGTVVNFRLVYDKETGRPKGFGFLEFTDVDAAASAVRNLNEHDLMGRTLRVDYSNDNSGGKQKDDHAANTGGGPPPPQFGGMPGMPGMPPMPPMPAGPPGGNDPSALPPLPQGVDLPPNINAPDAVSKTLQALSPPQLLDIISQMKNLATTEPQKASALLSSAPQLSYAIFQALLLMDLVDTSIVGQLVQQGGGPPPQQMQQPPPQAFPQQPPFQQPPPMYGAPPPQPPQPPQPQYGYAPTPPVQHAPYQPPPPQQQALPQLPPDQAAAIKQVLALPLEQIYAIPDEQQRNQILAVRQQYQGYA